MNRTVLLLLGLMIVTIAPPHDPARAAKSVRVETAEEFRAAVRRAKPGTRIELAAGEYAGGFHFTGLRGTKGKPIVIAAADPEDPPVIRGGGSGIQLSDPEHVELRGLVLEGQTGNGLNVDDGGSSETPARDVVLADLVLRDVGPRGNHDGIKLSGVVGFRVENCTVERWGTGGSAVDMVGCRDGVIEACTFRHTEGLVTASGVQLKGGTRDVRVRRNRFEHAGGRAVNLGGSTGLAYFRPPLDTWKGEKFEARDIVVEGNTFVGGQTAVAFVGQTGGVFRFNTVYLPGKWGLRILQENRAEGFIPSRKGVFDDNLIVFRADSWSSGGVNVGEGTEPGTFELARNVWYCADEPGRTRSLVRLPAEEKDGTYGKDPRLRDPEAGDLGVRPAGPAARAGAHALPE